MSLVKVSGNASGTGTLTIAAPNTNSDYTLTLPENTGTLISTASTFAGTGPAFSAYNNASQTITSNTFTKIQINTEEFDTNNNFDSTTNYRFTPTVAGYYQVSGSVNNYSSTSPTRVLAVIYKNGTAFKRFNDGAVSTGTFYGNAEGSALVYLNGSTDYVELYGLIVATVAIIESNLTHVYFQAVMVRGA
jgi:hypothetical protein